MVSRNSRTRLPAVEAAFERPSREGVRLAVRRVRLRSLIRIGLGFGWLASLVPAFLTSVALVWVLHGIWMTLDGWTPWTPWSPGTRLLPDPLEFAPREVLRLNGLYRALAPIGQHPVIGTVLITLALTFVGELGVTLALLIAGTAYNRFARLIGGIELEVTERPPRRPDRSRGANRASRSGDEPPDDWEEAQLRW